MTLCLHFKTSMSVFIDTDSSLTNAHLARESAFSPDRDRCQRNSRDGGELTPRKGEGRVRSEAEPWMSREP